MIIEKIGIELFGGIKNKEFLFSDGINVLAGENESGKSTVAAFIEFIFYGFGGKEEKEKYALDGKASGEMTVLCEKGKFRIERRCGMGGKGAPDESVDIFDLNGSVPIRGKDPSALFLGVDRNTFEKSLMLSQLNSHAISSQQMGEAVENLLESADESVNATESVRYLVRSIEKLDGTTEGEGEIAQKEKKLEELKKRLEKAEQQEAEYEKLSVSLKENIKKAESDKKEWEHYRKLVEHSDALHKLERLKRAAAATEKLKTVETQKAELEHSEGYNGFLPDRSYTEHLKTHLTEIQNRAYRIKEKEEEILRAEKKLEELPLPVEGEEKNLLITIQKSTEKVTDYRHDLQIAGVGSALALVLSVFGFVEENTVLGILFAVLAASLGAVSLLFALKWRKAKEKEKKLYDSVGAKNRDELAKAVERYTEVKAQREAVEKSRDSLKSGIEKEEAGIGISLQKANALAKQWGKTVGTQEQLEELFDSAERVSIQKEALITEEKQAKLELSALDMQVSDTEVKQLLTLIRTDGIKKELSAEEYKNAVMKVKFYKQTGDALTARAEKQKEQISALENSMEDSFELAKAAQKAEEELLTLQKKRTVLQQTKDALEKSMMFVRSQLLPGISKDASAFFKESSVGKYGQLTVESDFKMIAEDQTGKKLPVGCLSAGMAELAYLSVRLSISERLFENQPMPMVFDESFAYLDDLRQAAVFTALSERAKKGKMQMIYMTCRNREVSLLERIAKVHVISM